jgi:hypothetical protein
MTTPTSLIGRKLHLVRRNGHRSLTHWRVTSVSATYVHLVTSGLSSAHRFAESRAQIDYLIRIGALEVE